MRINQLVSGLIMSLLMMITNLRQVPKCVCSVQFAVMIILFCFSSGLNVDDLKQRTLKYFGPGSEYDTPVNDPYRDRGGKRTVQFL